MPVILERDWIIADYLISNSGVQVGLNQNKEYFEGELITPKTYDYPIVAEDIDVVVNGCSGKFYSVKFFETPASETWGTKSFLGQKIAGWIQFEEGSWSNTSGQTFLAIARDFLTRWGATSSIQFSIMVRHIGSKTEYSELWKGIPG